MTLPRTLLCAALVAGCGSSTVTPSDFGVAVDMHVGPTTLATIQPTTTACLAADATALYLSDSQGAVWKIPIGGGTPAQVGSGADGNGCVAVDGAGLYWFAGDKLMKSALDGSSAAALASGQQILKAPLVAAGGFVYWITSVYGDVDAYNGKNAIVRVPTAGGPVQVVSALVVGNPGGLAVDDTNVYYSDGSGTWARPLAAPATSVAFGQSALHGNALAVGGGRLAMTEIAAIGAGDLAVFRTDGMMRVVVSTSLGQPLAVDDRFVYANAAGAFSRFAVDGSGAATLWPTGMRAAAQSASTIFFTDGGAIYALAK